MNSGKSPATCRRFDFISSTARAQRLPAFDCSRESARDADCGSTTCAATDMWFSPMMFVYSDVSEVCSCCGFPQHEIREIFKDPVVFQGAINDAQEFASH